MAVAGDKSAKFQCHLLEIYFDMIGELGGYHLKLELIDGEAGDPKVLPEFEKI